MTNSFAALQSSPLGPYQYAGIFLYRQYLQSGIAMSGVKIGFSLPKLSTVSLKIFTISVSGGENSGKSAPSIDNSASEYFSTIFFYFFKQNFYIRAERNYYCRSKFAICWNY